MQYGHLETIFALENRKFRTVHFGYLRSFSDIHLHSTIKSHSSVIVIHTLLTFMTK